MSLDVYLKVPGVQSESRPQIMIREDGQQKEISREEWDRRYPGREPVTFPSSNDGEVYSSNVTHNLNRMADAAGIYEACWRPEEIGVTKASQLVPLLRAGLEKLKADPERFQQLNPSNGWGNYEGLVAWVEDYLRACEAYPDADVEASR